MTQQAEATATPHITFPIQAQAGSVTITVDRCPGGYALTTTALGQDTSAWCGGFTDLKTCLDEASRLLAAFEQHRTPDLVERHANGLRIRLAQQTSRPERMQDMAEIARLAAELAQLEDLSTKRNRARLVAQFADAA